MGVALCLLIGFTVCSKRYCLCLAQQSAKSWVLGLKGKPIFITWLSELSVTFLLLRRDTMIKAIYKRKHLIGGLLKVSEGKTMIIMAGSLAVVIVLKQQVRVHIW